MERGANNSIMVEAHVRGHGTQGKGRKTCGGVRVARASSPRQRNLIHGSRGATVHGTGQDRSSSANFFTRWGSAFFLDGWRRKNGDFSTVRGKTLITGRTGSWLVMLITWRRYYRTLPQWFHVLVIFYWYGHYQH
jgi:hypothetical protein